METIDPAAAQKMARIRRAGAIGNFIEYFDNALYAYFAVTIAALFFPPGDPVANLLATFAIFGVAFFIRPVGGIVFGYVGDRFGRKRQLIYAILLMSVSTAAIGILPTYESVGILAPLLLLVCRLAQGFSVGGESTGAFVMVVEQSPVGRRGRNAAPLVITTILGAAVAASLSAGISLVFSDEAMIEYAWRLPFFVALPLGIVGLILRARIGESDAFKEATKAPARSASARPAAKESPLRRAFRTSGKQMLTLFLWVSLVAVCGYMVVGYMVSHLVSFEGYDQLSALMILVCAQLMAAVGQVFMGRLADKFSRKQFGMLLSGCLAVLLIPTFFSLSIGPVVAAVALGIFSTFQYATMISAGCALVELFPVDVRSSASGLAYSLAFSVFGGTMPFVATSLSSNFGHIAPAYYAVAFAIVGFLVAWKGLPNARAMDVTSSGESLHVDREATNHPVPTIIQAADAPVAQKAEHL
ncbi:MFS transporter [Citricoccus parietis]|uniref:MFS transporter n=1 Tax=Citricoccus parietis TaxID=592307 RepID=A0ABV6F866_9MICC